MNIEMNNKIAFFDFDGTITTKDTLLEFMKFSKGKLPFYLGFLLNSPYLVAFKLKLISNQTAKERVLRYFFRNMPLATFEEECRNFVAHALPFLLRPKAIREIEQLKEKGFTVTIVSASPENWIRPWADSLQLNLLGTRLEVREGKLTGKVEGRNCHGEEKVSRITENYTLADYSEIYAYGDTGGDKPMLKMANISFYKPFR
ncbi:HAD family hydrolase [Flavitalea flava]